VNPFGFIQKRTLDTVSRKPFTPPQIERILSAAEKVSQWGDLVILMSSTALRRGDAATLTWDRVNLDRDQIQVRTQKTDEWVWLPIFPRLKKSLLEMRKIGTTGYILPAVAPIYAEKPDHVDLQVRKILASAGFAAGRGAQGEGEQGVRVSVPGGRRRVSVAGSHAFRTTFITLALSAGVPIEIVRRITGHHTVEVVRQNYFAPDSEAIRSALTAGMPFALTGAKPLRDIGSEAAELFRGLAALPSKDRAARKKRLLALWAEATPPKKK
jgi:integrase